MEIFHKILQNYGMKKMKLSKTSKNDGLPQDFFRRAKRAGKIAVLGLAEKKTLPIRVYKSRPDENYKPPGTSVTDSILEGSEIVRILLRMCFQKIVGKHAFSIHHVNHP